MRLPVSRSKFSASTHSTDSFGFVWSNPRSSQLLVLLLLLFSITALIGVCYVGWKATALIWAQEHAVKTSGKLLIAFAGACWVLFVIAFLIMIYYSIAELRSDLPIMHVDSKGIMTRDWEGQLLAWQDVTAVQESQYNEQPVIIFTLNRGSDSWQRTRSWHNKSTLDCLFSLNRVANEDRILLFYRLHKAFGAYGQESIKNALLDQVQSITSDEVSLLRLKQVMPQPWALYGLLLFHISVWGMQLFEGIDVWSPSAVQLWRAGANSTALVKIDNEYWRLLTSISLHHGVQDLMVNLITLWFAGKYLNRILGHGLFLLIYLGSAIIAATISLHFAAAHIMVTGAAPGVLGVCGAAMIYLYAQSLGEHQVAPIDRNLKPGVVLLTCWIFLNGLIYYSADSIANLVGLVTGALIAGLTMSRKPMKPSSNSILRKNDWVAISVVLIALALVATPSQPKLFPLQWFAWMAQQEKLQPQIDLALKSIAEESAAAARELNTEDYFRERLRKHHIPKMSDLLRALDQVPVPQGRHASRITNYYLQLREVQDLMLEIESELAQPPNQRFKHRITTRLQNLQTKTERLRFELEKLEDLQ